MRIRLLETERGRKLSECIITSTSSGTHLGEHVKEGVRVGVDHWRDVRDAARHVRLHDRHLDKGANLTCAHSVVFIFGATVSLSYFLVKRLSLSYFLVKRLSLSYFLVEVAFSIGRLHLLVHRPPHQLSLERIESNIHYQHY